MIDERALIDPDAQIAPDAEIGPWTVIGPGVRIGPRTRIEAHVVIKGPTEIGADNHIFSFCSIGDDPQDKKFDRSGGKSMLTIGDRNTFREYTSINRGTPGGGGLTSVGNDNWIMAYCHIAHDCHIGNSTVFANNSTLAGHVEIHDHVILGGFTGVHQFCRMGEGSFSAISAVIVRDVPPFTIVDGNTARARGLNKVGLKRRGVDTATIQTLKHCYRVLYREGRRLKEATALIAEEAESCESAATLLKFIRSSERGLVR